MGYRDLPQLVDVRGNMIRNGAYSKRSWSQITDIARHHSVSTGNDGRDISGWHANDNGWPSIGYHFVILEDGTIEWTNSVNRIGYHVGNNNTPLIGVCSIGNGSFTQAQEDSWEDLVKAIRETDGLDQISISDVKGHNEYPGHATNGCPGINMDTVRSRLRGGSGGSSSGPPKYGPNNESFASYHDDKWMVKKDSYLESQQLLNRVEDAGLDEDGILGQNTLNATRDFHDKYNISKRGANFYGVPGPATLKKLRELDNDDGSGDNPAPKSGEGIVDYLNRIGVDSSYNNRKSMAESHGITNYSGTASQNTKLLELVSGSGTRGKSSNPPANSGEGIVDYMNRIGMDSSYDNRKDLAENTYGISNYTGTASQNNDLLNELSG
ncbi:N-acetylmuramoyl-L-alanine amidase [Salicibibacter kimchii]|uniref:Autolysin n=1 Tax=Salicibibacter kimchii TaxID=2099786 RepID=A0A345BUK5_9BACI|nr:N-acetylmuramoyl-L-alanine amidase [Salicibibacter kimchii]AXF54636.1 hypothetical protein DT065_00475 [Salicibibacter kimchii]